MYMRAYKPAIVKDLPNNSRMTSMGFNIWLQIYPFIITGVKCEDLRMYMHWLATIMNYVRLSANIDKPWRKVEDFMYLLYYRR